MITIPLSQSLIPCGCSFSYHQSTQASPCNSVIVYYRSLALCSNSTLRLSPCRRLCVSILVFLSYPEALRAGYVCSSAHASFSHHASCLLLLRRPLVSQGYPFVYISHTHLSVFLLLPSLLFNHITPLATPFASLPATPIYLPNTSASFPVTPLGKFTSYHPFPISHFSPPLTHLPNHPYTQCPSPRIPHVPLRPGT